jgi:LPS-assembly protein
MLALPMISRTGFIITAALVCHLLLTPPLVTSQLLSGTKSHKTVKITGDLPAAPSASSEDEVTIRAIQQEKDGPVFKLRGEGEVHYRGYSFYADEITYNQQTGDSSAEGHVVLDGGPNDEHIEASHATYNIHTQVGSFYDVVATTGVKLRGTRSVLTTENPFAFTGKMVEKTGPDHYVVHQGTVTTCQLPHPKWQFNAQKVVVDVAGDAKIYNSDFRIRGIPVFYFPFATHPVQPLGRQSGFMIPNVGQSSTKGYILGESLFWAMDRSMDLTLGTQYFSRRGWAPHGEFRAQPSATSFVDLNYQGMFDRGIGFPPQNQGGQNVRLTAEGHFPADFRGVARIDYLSSFVYRLAFNEVFTQPVTSEVKSQAFLSKMTDGYGLNAMAERYQNFESTAAGDVITILHTPSFNASGVDHRVGRSPLYWAFDAAGEGLSRSEPGFTTADLVGRFDLQPSVSLPLHLKGWDFRPELALRDTFYTQRLVSNGSTIRAQDDLTNRKTVQASFDMRPPPLERVFDHELFGRKFKHVLEPRVRYDYVTGVNNFSEILRFDERDILADTNELEYAITNRLYAKKLKPSASDCAEPPMPTLAVGAAVPQSGAPWQGDEGAAPPPCDNAPQAREIITWELKQKYFFDPTFGGALIPGIRNVFTTTAEFSGISFLTDQRRFSPIVSRLRFQTSTHTEAEWDLDYDTKKGRINSSTTVLNYFVGPFTLGGGDAYLLVPSETPSGTSTAPTVSEFHQFRLLLGYGHPTKRGLSAASSIGFDTKVGVLQYAAVQTAYNWDCCGVSLEYRRFALGSVRNENQYRFNFSLANIATLGNLRRQERLY